MDVFERNASDYDAWFEEHAAAYASELQAVRELWPSVGIGLEIGVGTGRFAAELGIRFGVEPAAAMREAAENRGLEVFNAKAEALPFADETYDAVLMVTTVCFLDDLPKAFEETYRVLKGRGYFVVGLIDRDSSLGRRYERHKDRSTFYSAARFHSTGNVAHAMEEAGFVDLTYRQTLFGDPDAMQEPDPVRVGYGDGAFVVIRGRKPSA
ncbi:MAG: class I SAM-dependent methyltransferase [Rhodothermales bacterium]